ncbi:hypothetical protein Y032_0638g978 [Ancylostoma ceylanicum]|uniref:Surfactant protein B n=1 Tax=Ancylostoma ceylanicum TaxID=53326 RepID=A0A016WJ66_9BILA|nr:hypothetical protein Y032_0638g978 [Ancylostoma ceylanicum]
MIFFLFLSMLFTCSEACQISKDWKTCKCPIEDGPMGAFQLVSGYFTPKILKQLIDVAAESICNQRTMKQIKDDILKAIPLKLSISQMLEFTAMKKGADNCLKSLGSNIDKLIDKASNPLSAYLNKDYNKLKKLGLDTTKKTGKKCNAILPDLYKQACPMLTEHYVKKGIQAVKPKLAPQEWKCLVEKAAKLVRWTRYI